MSGKEHAADSVPSIWRVAFSKPVAKRAIRVAMIVGVILAVINHGDSLWQRDIDASSAMKIMLTFCVPYLVSSYSSVIAVRESAAVEATGTEKAQEGS
ncbi:MAG: nitrate/nitrite transporter NrtS [Roseovarius sp.]|jgi:hypothetical protein|uniref:nitrate/nitrite transporter NrtS n=1 Tax=Roseovarius sp. TaxID=1486281 RepID=UPI0032ECE157